MNSKRTFLAKHRLWQTLLSVLCTCALCTCAWIALHGVPLAGLPDAAEVESVTIRNGAAELTVTGPDRTELLVKAAHLLNYRPWGATAGTPTLTVIYRLSSGETVRIEANRTTLWWRGKAHALKEPDVFVTVIEGLFFAESDAV